MVGQECARVGVVHVLGHAGGADSSEEAGYLVAVATCLEIQEQRHDDELHLDRAPANTPTTFNANQIQPTKQRKDAPGATQELEVCLVPEVREGPRHVAERVLDARPDGDHRAVDLLFFCGLQSLQIADNTQHTP